ncbi:MAG: uroporphyrinogen decarboxylase [Eubacteriaceae bacterium]|nr:uroporphyrinogen decarboxylase [Eubacteriaceae bacterium]
MANAELKAYREKLFTDLYTNIVPDRVPVYDGFSYEFYAQAGGGSLLQNEYNMTVESLKAQIDEVMKIALGDYVAFSTRNPYSIFFKKPLTENVGKTGMQQHPEVEVMKASDYDEFIKDPYGFYAKHLIFAGNLAYDKNDPVKFAMALLRNVYQAQDYQRIAAAASAYMREEYDFFPNPPAGTSGYQMVPFDVLADRNRGFSEITKDIKRIPDKVIAAMDALMPYCISRAAGSKPHPLGANSTMTHMGAFLRTKEFEKFYWKYFYELVQISAERGQHQVLFCEHDWTRFVDYMQDFPMGTRLFMEYGDPQYFKDKLGKTCVLGGFYPLALLKTGTREQCLDEAKKLLDIMAPGGNYYFRTDKSIMNPSDINVDNYTAVVNFVKDNYRYDNAGDKVTDIDPETTIARGLGKQYPEFKSEYWMTYDDYAADYPAPDESVEGVLRSTFRKYQDMAMRNFLMG